MKERDGWVDYEDFNDEEVEVEETEEWEYFDCEDENQMTLYCDTCDREFYDENAYNKHMSEHRMCNLDGCTFTAHEKVIEKHVRMQHATGLYDKIRNVNTPEDIAKWIRERKMKYPSKENVVKRQQEIEERSKRGERITPNNNRFGKDKYRLQKKNCGRNVPRTKQVHKKRKIQPDKKVSLINEKCNWNGNMFPFRGTSALEEEPECEKSEYEDDEWNQIPSGGTVLKLNNALSGLMGAYASDSGSDQEAPKMGIANNKVVRVTVVETKIDTVKIESKIDMETTTYQANQSDDEPPDEVKVQRADLRDAIPCQSTSTKANVTVTKNVRKRKRAHAKHKNTKQVNRKSLVPDTAKRSEFPYAFTKRKVTLLEKLLQSEIRHERNVLLQCVRYVVSRNFFKTD